MAPDDTDVTDTDGQLIAPIIPLRREPTAPVLTVLADEPAPPRREPEPRSEASERSIWDDATNVLPRRDPAPAGAAPSADPRGTVHATRWLSLTAGILAAAAMTAVALLSGAIGGFTSHTPHSPGTPALHASAPISAVTPVGHLTGSKHPQITSTGPPRSTRREGASGAAGGAAHPGSSRGATTRARAVPAPAEPTSSSSQGSAVEAPAAASAGQEFGFEKQ